MLATIAVSYNIPILTTHSPQETASVLYAIARREQLGGKEFQYHTGKPQTEAEQLEYVVASIPGIGNHLAKPLLENFETIHALVNASIDEIKEVPGIGPKKAEIIHRITRRRYERE